MADELVSSGTAGGFVAFILGLFILLFMRNFGLLVVSLSEIVIDLRGLERKLLEALLDDIFGVVEHWCEGLIGDRLSAKKTFFYSFEIFINYNRILGIYIYIHKRKFAKG